MGEVCLPGQVGALVVMPLKNSAMYFCDELGLC